MRFIIQKVKVYVIIFKVSVLLDIPYVGLFDGQLPKDVEDVARKMNKDKFRIENKIFSFYATSVRVFNYKPAINEQTGGS